MTAHKRIYLCFPAFVALLFLVPCAPAQTHKTAPVKSVPPAQSDKEVADQQDQLLKLLRLSPTLTTVVAHDPSLLADKDYVARNNPELAKFLTAHPEITRNPDFYLFTNLDPHDRHRDHALVRAVWPEMVQQEQTQAEQQAQYEISELKQQLAQQRNTQGDFISSETTGPFFALLAFASFLAALVWLTRFFVESRRWSRIFKLQSEVHNRLIEKFGSTQELAAYMESEAGKRFLEASPIAIGLEPERKMPNAVSRVLLPLQIGIVLALLGVGLLSMRHTYRLEVPMLLLGTLALMPGLGFILSAAVSWVLADRLGLMPEKHLSLPPQDRL
jgi:hypothetical protein